eukprot:TRINITY_DN27161_c0_g1_i1.p1 TRINITY_DN27161_c0_g1~~TRINITY_DN27161_c0_g1_i1.p1  ORF type:complete len:610 (+),score=100.51 TRINITY_DN27161_c0_g1_i1:115-1830(+)
MAVDLHAEALLQGLLSSCEQLSTSMGHFATMAQHETNNRWQLMGKIIDAAASLRTVCRPLYVGLRMLMTRAPKLFSMSDLNQAEATGLLKPMSYDELWDIVLTFDGVRRQEDSVLAVLRILSEVPVVEGLRETRQSTLDQCLQVAFTGGHCMLPKHRGNRSLWLSFYRHRDPGLPEHMIAELSDRVQAQRPSASATSVGAALLRTTGLLARADRERNLGSESWKESLRVAIEVLRISVRPFRSLVELLPAPQMFPTHLVWQLLDKLSLPNVVPLRCTGWGSEQTSPVVHMSVLPDRDLVSDSVRFQRLFHCPRSVRAFLVKASATKKKQEESTRPTTFVEVGGFLGDCMLWAGGGLGKDLKGLEIEPVAAATNRMHESLQRADLSDSVQVLTEALGDGRYYQMCGGTGDNAGTNLANPNFGLHKRGNRTCELRRLRTLDEAIADWYETLPATKAAGTRTLSSSASPADRPPIDLLRIKTGKSCFRIAAGLEQTLRTGSIQRLLIEECYRPQRLPLLKFLAKFPEYRLLTKDDCWFITNSGQHFFVLRGLDHGCPPRDATTSGPTIPEWAKT